MRRCSRCSTGSGSRATACARSGGSSRRSPRSSRRTTVCAERNRTLAAEVRDLKDGRTAHRGAGPHRPRHDRRERDVLPGRAAGSTRHAPVRRAPATGDSRRNEPAARRWAVVPAAGRGERFGVASRSNISRCSAASVIDWSIAALLAERVDRAVSSSRWRAVTGGCRARAMLASPAGPDLHRRQRAASFRWRTRCAPRGRRGRSRLGAGARRRPTVPAGRRPAPAARGHGSRSASAVCWPRRSATR